METALTALTAALVSGFTDCVTAIMDALGKITPAALPVMCGVMVITVGISVFKRVARG